MSCVSASAATCRVAPAVRGQRFNKRAATVAPRAHNRRALAIQAAVDLNAVTLADTKRKFVESYPYPIPSIWSVAVNELLANQHFVRYNTRYSYSKLSSLGFVSVYDQLFEGFPSDEEKAKIFDCFVEALDEDPEKCRKDAAELAKFAKEAGGVDALLSSPVLAEIKSNGEANKFAYSRYDAIGLFRMLELGGATEPAALEKLADAAGLKLKKVNGDLGMYKGLLSKLAAAKELQKEIFEREKRKTAERLAKKEAANDATA